MSEQEYDEVLKQWPNLRFPHWEHVSPEASNELKNMTVDEFCARITQQVIALDLSPVVTWSSASYKPCYGPERYVDWPSDDVPF